MRVLQSAIRPSDRRLGTQRLRRKPEATVVMLIPSRTDTAYFHDWIFGKASEVRFLRGRLKFTDEDGNGEDAAPFPSAVIVWRSPERTGREFATWHI